jgi:hypothetical protein
MGVTVVTECLSEHTTALKAFPSQPVTISLRLIAEVLGLGQDAVVMAPLRYRHARPPV